MFAKCKAVYIAAQRLPCSGKSVTLSNECHVQIESSIMKLCCMLAIQYVVVNTKKIRQTD